LYRIVLDVYEQYIEHPTERDFLFLVLGLIHLREWIAESPYFEIERKQKASLPLTAGERFFIEIYDMHSFKVIQELCNRGKHFIV